MPIYNYTCKKCGKTFEVLVPLKQLDDTIKCPNCKSELERMMTTPAFKIS